MFYFTLLSRIVLSRQKTKRITQCLNIYLTLIIRYLAQQLSSDGVMELSSGFYGAGEEAELQRCARGRSFRVA